MDVILEANADNEAIAWSAQAPWLSGQGPTRETAIEDLRKTVRWWLSWMDDVFPSTVFEGNSVVLVPSRELCDELRGPAQVVDEIITMVDPRHGDTCGLLPSDRKSVTEEDVAQYHTYLRLSRDRLLISYFPIHAETVRHVARGELYYCSCAFPSNDIMPAKDLPEEPLKAIEAARNVLLSCTSHAIGVDVVPTEHRNEEWTPRKVYRRALWHELWHTMRME